MTLLEKPAVATFCSLEISDLTFSLILSILTHFGGEAVHEGVWLMVYEIGRVGMSLPAVRSVTLS